MFIPPLEHFEILPIIMWVKKTRKNQKVKESLIFPKNPIFLYTKVFVLHTFIKHVRQQLIYFVYAYKHLSSLI